MIERRRGAIVTISSGSGMHGGIGPEPPITYSASKAAEVGFTKSLAKKRFAARSSSQLRRPRPHRHQHAADQ